MRSRWLAGSLGVAQTSLADARGCSWDRRGLRCDLAAGACFFWFHIWGFKHVFIIGRIGYIAFAVINRGWPGNPWSKWRRLWENHLNQAKLAILQDFSTRKRSVACIAQCDAWKHQDFCDHDHQTKMICSPLSGKLTVHPKDAIYPSKQEKIMIHHWIRGWPPNMPRNLGTSTKTKDAN